MTVMKLDCSNGHAPVLPTSAIHGILLAHRARLLGSRSGLHFHPASKPKLRLSPLKAVPLGAAYESLDTLVPVVRSVSTVLYSLTVLAGAAFISRQLLATEQDRFEERERCPRCKGTGMEPCICARWSDHDVGCGSCNHTGYMKCSSCGGGGTAVPISLYIRKGDPSPRRF